ncbi:GLPGLI family protein [bacterium]|nr:GLPGLI family protein [bacterium]
MKTTILIPVLAGMLLTALEHTAAQHPERGTVTYLQTTRYDFAALFNIDANSDERAAEYVASLPTSSTTVHTLYFSGKRALFEEDADANKNLPQELEGALAHLDVMAPPRIILQKVYWDLDSGETIRHIEFMTRPFHVTGPAASYSWKLTGKQVRIENYVCHGAETVRDGNTITAWFSPAISVPIGPAEFGGLPGLILAVDVNGETVFVATEIGITPPDEMMIVKPAAGKGLTQEELDALVKEKTREWEDTKGSRTNFHR